MATEKYYGAFGSEREEMQHAIVNDRTDVYMSKHPEVKEITSELLDSLWEGLSDDEERIYFDSKEQFVAMLKEEMESWIEE